MMQSTGTASDSSGLHVAIIMDGNGRWATQRGLPRVAGHRAGAKAVDRTVEAARRMGIDTLTLFAFSSDNWQRPSYEVAALMRLFREYLLAQTPRMVSNGIRLNVIGRRDRLPLPVRAAIEDTENATKDCSTMLLRVAVDYSARDSIVSAAAKLSAAKEITREEFTRILGEVTHSLGSAPDVDMLIRTSGEKRLSDFLLWECAYAELYFTDRMWPEFDARDVELAIQEFHSRERRFGRVVHAAVG
jgi:undecaprenyl diphosphate synthase